MKKINVIIILILAVVFAIVLSIYGTSVSTYSDFQTARKNPNTEVHIIGKRVNTQQEFYDPQKDLFRFTLEDSLGNRQVIHYYDPKPANFEMSEKVVVIGEYKDSVFVAKKILQKCPSKYKGNETLNAEDLK